jgi:hypothetical protein
MRKLALLLALMLCPAFCQSPAKPLEPEILGVPFLLDSASQVLKPLADENWKAQTKRSGMFVVNGVITVSGEHSAVRVAGGGAIQLVFKVEHPESVKLYQATSEKNQRIIAIVKTHGAGTTEERIPSVAVVLTKYGESSYKLVPQSPLVPGEYAVIYSGKVMTFGIDG